MPGMSSVSGVSARRGSARLRWAASMLDCCRSTAIAGLLWGLTLDGHRHDGFLLTEPHWPAVGPPQLRSRRAILCAVPPGEGRVLGKVRVANRSAGSILGTTWRGHG